MRKNFENRLKFNRDITMSMVSLWNTVYASLPVAWETRPAVWPLTCEMRAGLMWHGVLSADRSAFTPFADCTKHVACRSCLLSRIKVVDGNFCPDTMSTSQQSFYRHWLNRNHARHILRLFRRSAQVGKTAAEIWPFDGFQNGGRPLSWVLKIQFFNGRDCKRPIRQVLR